MCYLQLFTMNPKIVFTDQKLRLRLVQKYLLISVTITKKHSQVNSNKQTQAPT